MKISRNAPCVCGSGLKYKNCCLRPGSAGQSDPRPAVSKSPWAEILLAIALLVSGSSVFKNFQSDFEPPSRHPITLEEKKFESIKPALVGQKIVGYVNETWKPLDYFDASASSQFYLAQYALAPVVLDGKINHDVVVGVFPPGYNYEGLLQSMGLAVRMKGDNGVVAFDNAAKTRA